MASGDRGPSSNGLARVSYFPGVTPPAAETDHEVEETEQITSSPEPSRTAGLFSKAFGLERDAAEAAANTAAGDDAEPESTKRTKPEKRAENVSIAALTRRGMSRWELEKTLVSRELEPEVIEAELDRLESVGLVDDGALAETIVRTQHDRKGLGRGALTAELRRRHIDQEHIDAALEQVDDDDEQSRATELALKRASQLSSYDFDTAKRRLTAFLMRKGYGSSVVRNAVDEALGGRIRSTGTVRFR
jgi:regulatory protein